MELSVRVVCRPELSSGFALAGVQPSLAADPAAALQALQQLAADPTVGVVLVEDVLHRGVPEEYLRRLDRQALPVVTSFPSPHFDRPVAADEVVLEILRQAIGYRVRPR